MFYEANLSHIAWLPFVIFAVTTSVTPGPNNLLIMSVAARNGIDKTLPAICGISLAFGSMLLVTGVGLAGPLLHHAAWQKTLQWIGAIWILWMAWQIGTAPGSEIASSSRQALPKAYQTFGYCWINPKAWVMALALAATYLPAGRGWGWRLLCLSAVKLAIGIAAQGVWAALGTLLGGQFNHPDRVIWCNRLLGALLASSVISLFL